ncbi:CfaE/CblD family pilus tip adhesin [Yersinia kristensenii]|uniref:CfaE/CblD family pilus tip adhesin n=2 Tax=Yersinia kristensenii TaxID=28152 RepID=UPI001E4152E4|nr:CfaE/CblD family pilus tip adhesin [Yersinia kristensenii]MDA5473349.1 CfaE/CblD family pilus tip adhesin [Yersinia kristensenii]MDA5478066.1 CfaE/CblD family pilus tip adhesin [Yersinia kristensenii]
MKMKMKMNNRFGKRIFYLLGIIMGILLSLSSAKADDWSRHYPVETTIGFPNPKSVPVWKDVRFKGKLPNGQDASSHLYLICHSESDTSFGACPTRWKVFGNAAPAYNVSLRFTNIKTRATIDLTVTGKWNTDCYNGRDGFTGVLGACVDGYVKFETNLTETELRKLPSAGVWTAQMRLKTMTSPEDVPIGEIVTDIKLHVQSEAGISIPNPTVKLPVTMTWHSEPEPVKVDTCLFDGTGAGDERSSQYTLRLDDVSGAAKGDLFALKNVTKPDARPLYYTVSAGTPGTGGDKMLWTPGMQKVFPGMDKVPNTGTMTIRGKTVPCVRWPLTLKLQPFNPARQAMGQYQGQINLVFTPSLNMP